MWFIVVSSPIPLLAERAYALIMLPPIDSPLGRWWLKGKDNLTPRRVYLWKVCVHGVTRLFSIRQISW
jgi:hypothetical protein